MDDEIDGRAACSRIARAGKSIPAIKTIVSSGTQCVAGRVRVDGRYEPSWPVFIAWSMSSASPPRTSPTMMRSGRIAAVAHQVLTSPRRALDVRRAGLQPHNVVLLSWSSAASSIVTIRSLSGIIDDITFSNVVLPVPVPPLTSTLSLAVDAAGRISACSGEAFRTR